MQGVEAVGVVEMQGVAWRCTGGAGGACMGMQGVQVALQPSGPNQALNQPARHRRLGTHLTQHPARLHALRRRLRCRRTLGVAGDLDLGCKTATKNGDF